MPNVNEAVVGVKKKKLRMQSPVDQMRSHMKDDIAWRKYWGEADKWEDWDEYYRGHFAGEGVIPVHLFFSARRYVIPQVYYRNPAVTMTSKFPGTSFRAVLAEHIVNNLMEELGLKQEIKLGAQDTFSCGTGFLLHGYDSEYGFDPTLGETTQLSRKGNSLIEYNADVLPGMPWTLRAYPGDVLLPWGCTRLKDVRRFTTRKVRLLEDVKDDPRYDKKVVQNLQPTGFKSGDKPGEWQNTSEEWTILYQTRDLRTGKVYVYTEDSKEFLREEDDLITAALGELPITPLVWNLNSRSCWGIPDSRIMESDQLEANTTNTLASRARRIRLPKFIYDKGVLEQSDIDNLTSERVGAGIGVDGGDFDSIIREIQAGSDPGLQLELQQIISRSREGIGHNPMRAGSLSAPTKRVTGKEVSEVSFGSDLGSGHKRDAIADSLKRTAAIWMKLITKFWKEPRFIHAPGIMPGVDWVLFRGTDLKTNYTYRIDPDDLRPVSHEDRKQEAALIVPQLIGAAQAMPGVNVMGILRELFKRFPGWDVEKIIPMPEGAQQGGGVASLTEDGMLRPLKPQGALGA